jgi:hypothetical protein
MAHHPRGYEVIYGFDTLDLFHNLFPEMLYDAEAFPDPTVRWMRDRMASLMPTPYARQRTLYEVYSMAQRRDWLHQWRNQQNTIPPIPQNSIHTNHTNLVPSTIGATGTASISTIGAADTAPISTIGAADTAFISTIGATTVNMPLASTIIGNASFRMDESHQINTLQNDDVGGTVILPAVHPRSRNQTATVLASLLQQGLTPQNILLNMLNQPDVVSELRDARQQLSRAWQDVLVIATNEIIEQGSRLLTNEEIHADEMCSVCQHHSEPDTEISTWRALYCGHSFHRDCIDQWFEQNVLCPVCRADIRDSPRGSAPSTPPRGSAPSTPP